MWLKIILIIKEQPVFWHKVPINTTSEFQTPIALLAYWGLPTSIVLVETSSWEGVCVIT